MRLEKITIIGHLGADARHKIKEENGFCSFSVCTTEEYQTKTGQTIKRGHWYNCILNNPSPAIVERLTKGTLIYIEGRPRFEIYKPENGIYQVNISVSVDLFKILSKSEVILPLEQKSEIEQVSNPDDVEEIPF